MSESQNITPDAKEKTTIQSRNIVRNSKISIKALNAVIIGGIAALIIVVAVLTANGGFTVTFNMDGGSSVPVQKVMHGEYIAEPPIPVKEGYVFGGWYVDEDLTKPWDFTEDTAEGSMTLYAKWIEK